LTAELLPENTWRADSTLRSLLAAWLPPQTLALAEPMLGEMGRAAVGELQAGGDACEGQPAVLRQFDGWGNRVCLLYTSPSPRDLSTSRMPSSA